MPGSILFAGDVHGNGNHMNWLFGYATDNQHDAIFVLGDFGIWDHLDGGDFTKTCSRKAEKYGVPVYFLPGNHENYDLLDKWEAENPRDEDGFVIVRDSLLYSPRAHRWTWDGVRFLSLGGAYSVDKEWRIQEDEYLRLLAEGKVSRGFRLNAKELAALETGHASWWPREEITQEEADRAEEGGEVDVMLTHDKPYWSTPGWNRKNIAECEPNQSLIQQVVDGTLPKLLLHGHLHYSYGELLPKTDTYVRALDCDPDASTSHRAMESIAALRIHPDRYTLMWVDVDKTYRDFTQKSLDGQSVL